MVDSDNPFDAPETRTDAILSAGSSIEYLQKMRLWQRLLSVVGLLTSVLLVVGALGMVLMVLLTGGASEAVMLGFVAMFYVVLGVVYVVPSLHLWRSASALRQVSVDTENVEHHVEQSLMYQFRFWRFVGVLTTLFLILYLVVLPLFLVFLTVLGSQIPIPDDY